MLKNFSLLFYAEKRFCCCIIEHINFMSQVFAICKHYVDLIKFSSGPSGCTYIFLKYIKAMFSFFTLNQPYG